jgi:hypothetical protein
MTRKGIFIGREAIAMTEMGTGNDGVEFPVYVVTKDCGETDAYASYKVMQSFLEAIDVQNDEYEAYDAEGFILHLSVGEQQSSWLRLARTQNQLSMSEFWEVKFNAVVHEEQSRPLLESLKRKLGLIKR